MWCVYGVKCALAHPNNSVSRAAATAFVALVVVARSSVVDAAALLALLREAEDVVLVLWETAAARADDVVDPKNRLNMYENTIVWNVLKILQRN